MKKAFLLLLSILLFSSMLRAQNKDCNIEAINSPIDHEPITGITVNLNGAKCILSKSDTSLMLIYKTSLFAAIMTAETIDVNVDIESVELKFNHDVIIKVPAKGRGTAENRLVLKPVLRAPTFSILLTPEILKLISSSDTVSFHVLGESGTSGFAFLSKRDLAKVKKAIACLQ